MQNIEDKVKDYLYSLAYDINSATHQNKDVLQSIINKKWSEFEEISNLTFKLYSNKRKELSDYKYNHCPKPECFYSNSELNEIKKLQVEYEELDKLNQAINSAQKIICFYEEKYLNQN